MRIAMIGSGVTGEATGIGLLHYGHDVIFYDIDERVLKKFSEDGYQVASNVLDAITESDVIFICVPTPTENGKMDSTYVEKAAKSIAVSLREITGYRVVAVKSTVLPFTSRNVVKPILEEESGLKIGEDIGLCMNPEFLRQKHALKDFLNAERIVIGEYDSRSGSILEKLYENFQCPVFRTDLETAEMVKYVANIFLANKISYFNVMHLISSKIGIDSKLISKIVALDSRIGEYGVYGGRPFGGACLPKDLESFISFTKDIDIEETFLNEIYRTNEKMKKKYKENEI